MIVKFFNRGSGGGAGPVDYLLGKERDRELATLNQGDPDEIINLINSCEFTQKYKSGCLSFEEENLPQAHKDKIMADFEKVLLPGLDKNQYSILWVEHRDKGRLELNFIVPCVELTTAKRLQPYYHAIDKKRVDTWKRVVNTSLDLHDPDAPENKRSAMDLNVTGLPQEKKLQCNHISNALLNQIEIGLIKNKSDIVRTLGDAGFTITRQAKNTISVKDPNGGKNIKLKGEIYEESFQFSREHASRVATAQADYDARKPAELAGNQAELARLCRAKSTRNKELYRVDRAEQKTDERDLRKINEIAREQGAAAHRRSDELSHIQDAEIQRCHTLNNAGIHGRNGERVMVDGAEHNKTTGNNSIAKEQGGGSPDEQVRWEALHQNESRPDLRGRGMADTRGVLNDRARKTPIERIGRIINQSRNHVQRVQKFFGELRKSLFETGGRKQKSDSVSNELNRASDEFNRAVEQVVGRIERQRKQELGRDLYSGMTP